MWASPSYSGNSESMSNPPLLRGRQRRRARRQWQHSQHEIQPFPHDHSQVEVPSQSDGLALVLRGRQRRRARRQWHISQGHSFTVIHDGLTRGQLAQAGGVAQTFRSFVKALGLAAKGSTLGHSISARSFAPTGTKSQSLPDSHAFETPRSRSQQHSADGPFPWWLTARSVERPSEFQRILAHLRPIGSRRHTCIDQSTAIAIREIGGDHSNELLRMLLESSSGVALTIAAATEIMSWVSLPMLKALHAVPLPIASPSSLLGVVPNVDHGLAILRYLAVSDHQPLINDDLFNLLLGTSFKSVTSAQRIFEHRTVEESEFYLQVCEMLVVTYPEKKIYSTTIASAVGALESFELVHYQSPPQKGILKTLVERCKEPYVVADLLDAPLGTCEASTLGMLLEVLPVKHISRSTMLSFFHRTSNVFGSGPKTVETLVPYFATHQHLLPALDILFISLQGHNIGPLVLRYLKSINPELFVTPLMARVALKLFAPKQLWKHFHSSEIRYDAGILLAALEPPHSSTRGQSPNIQVFRYLLSRSPAGAVTPEVVTAAALSMPATVLKDILDRNGDVTVHPLALLAATRSIHPALEKIALLLDKADFECDPFDTGFWISFINNNHRDTVKVFDLLLSRFHISTTDALIAAAWRSDYSAALITRLLKYEPSILSVNTITAILLSDTGDAKPRLFKWILKRINGLIIDNDLIADSFAHPNYCKILLMQHASPGILIVSAAKLRGFLYERACAKDQNDYDIERLRQSIRHYLDAGGVFSLSLECLETLLLIDFELALEVWRSQANISLLDFVIAAINREPKLRRRDLLKGRDNVDGIRARKELSALVDLIIHHEHVAIDRSMLEAFSPRHETSGHDTRDDTTFWAVMLFFFRIGDRWRFEHLRSRARHFELPAAEIEWLFASMITVPGWQDARFADLFEYLGDYFPGVSLGLHFFQSVQDIASRVFVFDEAVPGAWTALLDCSISIEWSLQGQALIVSTYSADLAMRIMTAIGDDFVPCEQLVLAAINSKESLLKVEYLWHRNPEMAVTQSMVEAAVRSTNVATLDFLIARSRPLTVTEELVRAAVRGIDPAKISFEDFEGFDDGPQARGPMVKVLMAHVGEIGLSQSTIELAIRNLDFEAAQLLLSHTVVDVLQPEAVLAMLDRFWPAEGIHHALSRDSRSIDHALVPEVVSHACRLDHGRALLDLLGISGQHHAAMQDALLAEAALKSTSSNWRILDHIHSAPHIVLTDHALAHLWAECTETVYSTRQPLTYLLEHGATGCIGPKTFESFGLTCMRRDMGRDLSRKVPRRVGGTLPGLPAVITAEVIDVATDSVDGRRGLDYLLGPDHVVTVDESALQKCARLGDEVWLMRLLQKMSAEQLENVDMEALLVAARVGAKRRVVEICIALAGLPESTRSVRNRILGREWYSTRQRRRTGRPRVTSVWRWGFERFLRGSDYGHGRSYQRRAYRRTLTPIVIDPSSDDEW